MLASAASKAPLVPAPANRSAPSALPQAGVNDPLAALAARASAGDDAAFNELVRAASDRLFNFLYRLAGQTQDAEDLCQETWLKAHRALTRYQPERPFLPWLFTIARRTLLNHRRAARPLEPLDEDLPAPASTSPAERDDLESLWRVARDLHPRYHHVLWLYYGEGFNAREVAAVLGTRPLVVKVLLHRARQALLAALRRSQTATDFPPRT